jgi:hypothetical protein
MVPPQKNNISTSTTKILPSTNTGKKKQNLSSSIGHI